MHKPVDSRVWLDYNLPINQSSKEDATMTTINTRNAMASFRMVDAVRFFSVLFFYRGFYYYYRAQNARLNRSV